MGIQAGSLPNPVSHPILEAQGAGGAGGEADATVKDHSSISSERERLMLGRGEGATAHRGPHRRGFSQAVHLPSPWGVPATPQTKTPTDLSINKLWQRS